MVTTRHEMQERRMEQKFLVSEDQAAVIAARLRRHLVLDRHSAPRPDRSYDVHSVYLDSHALESYWSTLHRKKNRFKLRVRFYDDDSSQPAFVEIKAKADGHTVKQRHPVPRHTLKGILSTNDRAAINPFAGVEDFSALEEFMQKVKSLRAEPKLHVAYRREAYVSRNDNSVRVTFDREVRSEPVNTLRLTTEMGTPRLLCQDHVVIEVKCSGATPFWLTRLIAQMELNSSRFTKYVFGIEQHGLNLRLSDGAMDRHSEPVAAFCRK